MRCTYIYPDNKQCTINAPPGKKMCTDHRLLTKRAAEKKREDAKRAWTVAQGRPSRAKPRPEPRPAPPPDPALQDHTAPWRCGIPACVTCAAKPTYNDYMRNR